MALLGGVTGNLNEHVKEVCWLQGISVLKYEGKERAEAGEHIIQPEQLGGQLVHMGNSLPRTDAAFARAVRMAISDPLAYAVEVVRDGEVVVRVLLDRRR